MREQKERERESEREIKTSIEKSIIKASLESDRPFFTAHSMIIRKMHFSHDSREKQFVRFFRNLFPIKIYVCNFEGLLRNKSITNLVLFV